MKPVIAAVIMIFAFLLIPRDAAACSCIFRDVSTSFRNATVVVVAKAVRTSSAIERIEGGRPGEVYEGEIQSVVWEVKESFKGSHNQQATFRTRTEVTCCMCGMSVDQGGTYVLYLHGEEPYGLSDCSGSSLLQDSLDSIPTLKRLSRRTRNAT